MSDWKQIKPEQLAFNPFVLFNDNWVVIAAEKEGRVNAMTASWGGLGELWNKQVATVYVRQSRYTHEFLEASDTFSITAFDTSYQRVLNDIMGSKSGRDMDKIKACNFTVERLDGTPSFEQGKLAIVCRKLYTHTFEDKGFSDKALGKKIYGSGDWHTIYIGAIEGMYEK